MEDAQSLRNKIADVGRQANLKRNEAEQHLKNAATHSGTGQPDQAASDQASADNANREAMDLEKQVADLQKRLTDTEARAADLDRQEQELQNKLSQVQQERDRILGKSGGFGPII